MPAFEVGICHVALFSELGRGCGELSFDSDSLTLDFKLCLKLRYLKFKTINNDYQALALRLCTLFLRPNLPGEKVFRDLSVSSMVALTSNPFAAIWSVSIVSRV